MFERAVVADLLPKGESGSLGALLRNPQQERTRDFLQRVLRPAA